ncbi:MAG: sigma-70 family RNA polymerase sigma factor [Lachnospiraceae bacterium]|nr:sigma-70 family RNA polymerase sigma factor [Lachnospiraceae bacterium]
MKYAPRKVYIKESGNYVELSYMDFCRRRQAGQSYMDKLLSLDGFTDSEGNVIDFIVDEAVDVVETVVHAVMVDRLKAALPLLSDGEQALIKAIFFEELSEREVGLRLGITQSVVNKRKARILAKLRKIMENKI